MFDIFKLHWGNFSARLRRNYLRLMRTAKHKRIGEPQPCIRCAKCVPVCPANLLPQQLFWHIQGQDLTQAKDLGLANCIKCRLCEQVCPSDIPLVSYYKNAKLALQQQDQERVSAETAKQNFLDKQARLANKLLRQQEKKNNIKAALARVKENNPPLKKGVGSRSETGGF